MIGSKAAGDRIIPSAGFMTVFGRPSGRKSPSVRALGPVGVKRSWSPIPLLPYSQQAIRSGWAAMFLTVFCVHRPELGTATPPTRRTRPAFGEGTPSSFSIRAIRAAGVVSIRSRMRWTTPHLGLGRRQPDHVVAAHLDDLALLQLALASAVGADEPAAEPVDRLAADGEAPLGQLDLGVDELLGQVAAELARRIVVDDAGQEVGQADALASGEGREDLVHQDQRQAGRPELELDRQGIERIVRAGDPVPPHPVRPRYRPNEIHARQTGAQGQGEDTDGQGSRGGPGRHPLKRLRGLAGNPPPSQYLVKAEESDHEGRPREPRP